MRFYLRSTMMIAVILAPLLSLSCGDSDDNGVTPKPTIGHCWFINKTTNASGGAIYSCGAVPTTKTALS